MRQVVKFTYKNHRGEVAERTVTVDSIQYLTDPGYGYPPGWFVSGMCHDRQARRSFAFANIVPEPVHVHGNMAIHNLMNF